MQSEPSEALRLLRTLCHNLRLKKDQWGHLGLAVGPVLLVQPVPLVLKVTPALLVHKAVEVYLFQRRRPIQKTL